jgi:hypothetical protein
MNETTLFETGAAACISLCGTFRYTLTRVWDVPKPSALFVMLNPSTADGREDDPTIRRCVGFAKAWGCGSLAVINLFALRTAYPRELRNAVRGGLDVIGPNNDEHIRNQVCNHADPRHFVVAAWGAHGSQPAFAERRDSVMELLASADLMCLGITASGEPRHPLYCPADLALVKYEAKGRP